MFWRKISTANGCLHLSSRCVAPSVYIIDIELCWIVLHDFIQPQGIAAAETVRILNQSPDAGIRRIRSTGLLDAQIAVIQDVADHVLAGLDYIRRNGLAHRDIKPENGKESARQI